MKINWKFFFGGSLILLISSNLFWMYQILDNSISHSYYQESCEKYDLDRNNLLEIISRLETKDAVINFLSNYNIEFDSFKKSDHFIISLNSFQLEYNRNGKLIDKNKF